MNGVSVQFQRQITELQQLRSAIESSREMRASIKLTWREEEKAPREMRSSYCAAVDGGVLYVRITGTCQVFSYTVITSSWSQLPNSIRIAAPQSSSTTSSLLLVAIHIVMPLPISCSASLGRAVAGGGLGNSHPCQQSDLDQQHCVP